MPEFKDKPILFRADMVRMILRGRKSMTRRLARDQETPPYHVGQHLWVREACAETDSDSGPCMAYAADNSATLIGGYDSPEGFVNYLLDVPCEPFEPERWKPSIFMPRWASRITLEVTAVRCEQVHAVTDADAIAEGIDRDQVKWPTARDAFKALWEVINGKRAPWESNPWVWVIEFRTLDTQENQ